MKKKQVVPFVLATGMLLAALSGCGDNANSSTNGNKDTSRQSEVKPDGSQKEDNSQSRQETKQLYPIVTDGSIKLKYWCTIGSQATQKIKTYNENTAYQEVMKKTGIELEFIHPANGQEKEQFNVLMLSDQLPDIISGAQLYNGGASQGVADGFFVELTPYLEKYAPDYHKLINSSDEAKRQIYINNKVNAFYPLTFEQAPPWLRPLIRQDILEECGLDVLATYDDYEKYYQFILDKHPDVVPMIFNASSDNYLTTMMTGYDMINGYFLKDGKIAHSYSDQNMLPFLTKMNEWYSKGYISKDSQSLDNKQIMAMYDAGQLGCYIDSVDNLFTRNANNEKVKIGSAPFPRLTKDQTIHTAPVADIRGGGENGVVTMSCKTPEAAISFLNFAYSEEGSRIYNYGREGVEWTLVNGEPQFTDKMLTPPEGWTYSNISFINKIHFAPKLCAPDTKGLPAMVGNKEACEFRMKWSDDPKVDSTYRVPPITLTEEENKERATIMKNVETYAPEMMLRFLTGAEPLSNYDSYLRELETLQLPRAIEITQAAYDRYMNQ